MNTDNSEAMRLADSIKTRAVGWTEWRVENPVDGGYVMVFTQAESLWPEEEAQEWLELHRQHHPNSMYADYVVSKHHCYSQVEQDALDAAALLRKLPERIAELEAGNGKLLDGLAKGLSEKTMLTELAMRNGGLYAGIEGGAAAVLASAFAEQFTSSGGVNYVEVSFMHPATGPICVTLQRVQGKTPHQLRREAEAERDQLRAEVERMRRICVEQARAIIERPVMALDAARTTHKDTE